MMDWTDRHFRFVLRQITRRTLLYTEMVTTGAIRHGDRARLLGFTPEERPLALQLGGDDPDALADCARIGEDLGYDEVNLNAGCPSDRVRRGRFGACLMAQPALVARCVAAMRRATSRPVTVKHRLGIDGRERYEDLTEFVRAVADAGCDGFVVHARLADLERLTPKQNRRVPPLRHDVVFRLKRDFPDLRIELNGNVRTPEQAVAHLAQVDGVMMGRAAYAHPFALATADRLVFGDEAPPPSREEVVEALLPYLAHWRARGQPLHRMTRHMLALFRGQPAARAWRRYLSEQARGPDAGVEVVRRALAFMPAEARAAR